MLLCNGYRQTHSDYCVYVHPVTKVIIAIWVDDLIIAGQNTKDIEELKCQLSKEFEMKDMGELKYFLRIQVLRNQEQRQIHINPSSDLKCTQFYAPDPI